MPVVVKLRQNVTLPQSDCRNFATNLHS